MTFRRRIKMIVALRYSLIVLFVIFISISSKVHCDDVSDEFTLDTLEQLLNNDKVAISANDSSQLIAEAAANDTRKLVACKVDLQNNDTNYASPVEVVNASRLAELLTPNADITSRETEAPCSAVFFYSRHCAFSIAAAPSFSALAKLYPDLKMIAIDSVQYSRVNTQYGIVGVPSIILFHNARAVAKYNGSEYLVPAFSKFINLYTGINEANVTLEKDDFVEFLDGNVKEEMDYILLLASTFVIIVQLYYFSKTRVWAAVVETVKNTWREAEAQHEHED